MIINYSTGLCEGCLPLSLFQSGVTTTVVRIFIAQRQVAETKGHLMTDAGMIRAEREVRVGGNGDVWTDLSGAKQMRQTEVWLPQAHLHWPGLFPRALRSAQRTTVPSVTILYISEQPRGAQSKMRRQPRDTMRGTPREPSISGSKPSTSGTVHWVVQISASRQAACRPRL